MRKIVRFQLVLAIALLMTGSICNAQSGAAVYKSHCQMCHGPKGMADTAAGKAMKVKPVTDPTVRKFSEEKMIDAVRHGMGKMGAYQGKLTEAQIKDVVIYFRTFVK